MAKKITVSGKLPSWVSVPKMKGKDTGVKGDLADYVVSIKNRIKKPAGSK